MVTITIALLVIVLLMVGFTLGTLLVMAGWIHTSALGELRLIGVMESIIKDISIMSNGMVQVQTDLRKLEKIAENTMSACEALVDMAGERMTRPNRSLRDGSFFTTDDGAIKANNITDFIDKLRKDPNYIELADDLKARLEKELAEDDDSDLESPFS